MAEGNTIRAEDIRDSETLEAWLEGRPREDAVVIAHRAALRVFPLFAAEMDAKWARDHKLTALPILRCHLMSAIAIDIPIADSRKFSFSVDAIIDLADPVSMLVASAAIGTIGAAITTSSATSAVATAVSAATTASVAKYTLAADAATAAAYIWKQLSKDAALIETETSPLIQPLWVGDTPGGLRRAERDMLARWQTDPPQRWDFWRRWWEGAKAGRYLNPRLQLAIVEGVDDATWDAGPDAVAARIREIEAEFNAEPNSPDTLAKAIDRLPPATTDTVGTVRRAMIAHRQELPPTFGSILGYISLEIERLQSKNYRDKEEAGEARRQIAVLSTLHEAIQRLQALVPSSGDMPQEDAQEAEKLTRLIFRRFQEWPRAIPGEAEDNIADIADSSIRGALIGACAYMAPMVGTSPDKALIADAVIFGGKKLIDTAKAAKDLVGGKVDK